MVGLVYKEVEVGAVELKPGVRVRLSWTRSVLDGRQYLRLDYEHQSRAGKWELGAFPSLRVPAEAVSELAKALEQAAEARPDE